MRVPASGGGVSVEWGLFSATLGTGSSSRMENCEDRPARPVKPRAGWCASFLIENGVPTILSAADFFAGVCT